MTRPKKSLGQNFLIDQNIIRKIMNTAEIEGNNIVEIGPGSGNLTKKIIEKKPNNLLLIEKDRDLFENLKKEFISSKNISIFNDDILDFDLEKNLNKDSVILGNLPYNISSQILVKLIKFKNWLPQYKKLVLMFQKEVADKILSEHDTKNYGRLTVIAKCRLKIIDHFNVSRHCFYPKPKVESTVLVFKPIINHDYKVRDIKNLEHVTYIFFSNKRKMINKAFNKIFKNPNKISSRYNIDLKWRPSQLTEKMYYKITSCLEDEK